MSEKQVEFSDVVLESFGRGPKGCKAKFHAKVNAKVSAALGWQELPLFLDGGTVDTDLHATLVELTPRQGEMGKFACSLKARRISDFTFNKVQEEGKGKTKKQPHTKVNFVVEYIDEKSCASLEKFHLNCGALKSSLRINYEPQPKQGSLVDVTNTADQNQASLTLV